MPLWSEECLKNENEVVFCNCLNIILVALIVSQNKIIESIYPKDKGYITLSIIAVLSGKMCFNTLWVEQTRCIKIVAILEDVEALRNNKDKYLTTNYATSYLGQLRLYFMLYTC
jgi:hypothetical protein